jgi:hypothetical protein
MGSAMIGRAPSIELERPPFRADRSKFVSRLNLGQPRGIANSALVSHQLSDWSTWEKRSGYRMGQVNGRRESRASESDSEPPAPVQGAQASAKNGRIPGLFRVDQQTERLSARSMLAEGSSLAANILFAGVR